MNAFLTTLTRWPFLVALAVLLANDLFLKSNYPGLVTGKLSDIAGIAMVALPLFAAFTRWTRTIYLGIAAGFLWWKSPASAGFIAFANEWAPYPVGRVVDYTDLAALLMLPICERWASLARRESDAPGDTRRRFAIPVALLAALATAATSYALPTWSLTIRDPDPDAELDRAAVAETIAAVMRKWRLECHNDCAQPEIRGGFSGRKVRLSYQFLAPNSVFIRISADPGLFGEGEMRRAARLRDAVKAAFMARFKDLEAIEPLVDPRELGWRERTSPAP